MKVIARRSKGLGALFLAAGIFASIYPFFKWNENMPPRVFGIFYLLMSPVFLLLFTYAFLFYRTPKDIVLYDGAYTLYLPRGVKIDAKDIINVSLRTSNRRTTRKGGMIIIETERKTYRVAFVANTDEAVKEINNIVYKRKSELGYTTMY